MRQYSHRVMLKNLNFFNKNCMNEVSATRNSIQKTSTLKKKLLRKRAHNIINPEINATVVG